MSVYKRGKSWSYSIVVGRDEQGRRRRVYEHGFRTKRAAQDARAAAVTARRGGVHVDPSKVTLQQFLLEQWLPRKMPREKRLAMLAIEQGRSVDEVQLDGSDDPDGDHAGRIKLGTYHAYESRLRVHVIPALGGIRMQELVGAQVEGLMVAMADRGLSPKTVKNTYGILNKALGDAVRWGLIVRNPCDVVEAPRVGRADFESWTLDEVRAFLAAIEGDEYLAAWLVFINTGMRRGELAGLTWPNIDLDAGELTIRWTVTESRGDTLWSGPKTKKGARRMALDPVTVAELRRWRSRQAEQRLLAGPAWQRTNGDSFGQQMPDVVFTYPDGSMIRPQTWRRMLHRVCDANGLRRVSPHALRHTYATLALQRAESMADMKALSDRLGHATISFTLDRYAESLPDRDRKLAADVAALWHGADMP